MRHTLSSQSDPRRSIGAALNWAEARFKAESAACGGSGSAAVLEAARVLSNHKFRRTIVYALLSGKEQGLYGGKLLADYAKVRGWNVIANLNNDIIGNVCGSDGVCDSTHIRIFSEGPRWRRTDAGQWQASHLLGEAATGDILPHIRVDDWVFGVSSIPADGFESTVASAVPGGAFHPYVAPPVAN